MTIKFEISPDGVNADKIPKRILKSGAEIPAIGLGTFGSDGDPHIKVAEAVIGAISVGYRHIDCAAVYGNENLIGESLKIVQDGGIKRKDLWITGKLWNDKHDPKSVIPACEKSLNDLQLDYLDLYLVHWPFPNTHPVGCDGESRSDTSKPYIHENYMKTWAKMEELVDIGLVKNIGSSNMTIPKMELLLRDASIKPVVEELELHPHFQQPEFYKYLVEHEIQPIGYSPIGSPARPNRDRTPEDTNPLEDPTIIEIARKHGIHTATLCVKWGAQRGQVPIPFSTTPRNYLSNIKSLVSNPLTDEEMKEIANIDKNCKFIKGQVFLWKQGQSWEDLWDLNGKITPE